MFIFFNVHLRMQRCWMLHSEQIACLVLTFLPDCTFYHTGCQCLLMVTFNYDDTYWLLLCELSLPGDVAQMVERSLSMWEVGGSIPPVSKIFCLSLVCSCLKWTKQLFSWFDQQHKTLTRWSVCKIDCIVRESNPGRPRGRRAFYHWTNDALLLIEAFSPKS